MPDEFDVFLSRLRELTEKISESLADGDVEAAGRLIGERRKVIDGCSVRPGEKVLSEEQKKRLMEVLALDKRNELAGKKLKAALSEKIKISERLGSGLIGYIKCNRNLSNGQLIDKKR